MKIVLMGMKHCGKSTLGRALAERYSCPFYDIDELIVAAHARRTGRTETVREIFASDNGRLFSELETQVVRDLHSSVQSDSTSRVIALGGRTIMNDAIAHLLPNLGSIIYLRVSPADLLPRILAGGLPPFLNPADPAADFQALCEQRMPRYEQLADWIVDLDGLDVQQALAALIQSIQEHAHER